MKRLAITLFAALCLQFAACGGGNQADHATDTAGTNGSIGESTSPNSVRNSTGKPQADGDTSTLQTSSDVASDTGSKANP